MKETRAIMGMPVTVELVGADAAALEPIFAYFVSVDERFSTYKPESEISRINRKEIAIEDSSDDMREIFARAAAFKTKTKGYFDIEKPDGSIDPSGIVKGWAIRNAAHLARERGHADFWIEAGGDIQTNGRAEGGAPWSIGVRSPFALDQIVKVVYPEGRGVATSGTYLRGTHIYDPHMKEAVETPFVSLTVIGPDIYEADLYATAAFAMGKDAVAYIHETPGLEAYAIDTKSMATYTPGFARFTTHP